MPAVRIGLWIVVLVGAMLLPFLPGRYDPLAVILSASAAGISFGGLLLVPIGVVWLTSARGYGPALAAAAIPAAGAALVTAVSGSIAAAIIILMASVAWLLNLRLYFEHPSTDFATREIVMYNPRGEQDFSSHVFDLLQFSPEQIRRQRGHYASEELAHAGWKRFLFD